MLIGQQPIVAHAAHDRRLVLEAAPAPGIAEPRGGKNNQRGLFGAAVDDGVADYDVVHIGFGVLDEHVEITVVLKGRGVDQLKFAIEARAPPVFLA